MNVYNKCDQRLSQSLTQMMASNGVVGIGRDSGRVGGQPSKTTTTTTQQTQTTLSSAALPALTPQQQLSVNSPSITIQTIVHNNNRKPSAPVVDNISHSPHPNSKNKQQIKARTNGLYEGSHIHFSPVDNKPLCSYSTKLCKQRRINGYAFCIRHILEDPSAPFRQCRHVAKYNQQKCSNAIPANEDREFCNSHMQIAGMAPKKERKDKKKESTQLANHSVTNNLNNNQKCVSVGTNGLNLNKLSEKVLTTDRFQNFNAFIKPNLKLNGIQNNNNIINNLKINYNLNNNNNNNKNSNKCLVNTNKSTTTTTTSTETSSPSSHSNSSKINNNSNQLNPNLNKRQNNNKRPKRKKKDKKCVEKFVFAKKSKINDNLFNHHIWTDSEEELELGDSYQRGGSVGISGDSEDVFPLIFGTLSTNLEELESNELKNELISQKWVLKNLISIRNKDFSPQLESTRNILKTLNRSQTTNYSYLDHKLEERAKRSPNSIRKGICRYASDESCCRRPSLPFSRHCVEHILYNVDQLLFSRCTAKCVQTMTQCSRPTFDITREEPLCSYHQTAGQEVDGGPNSPSNDLKNSKKRKKTKPMALTRVSRRGKKRRKGPNGTDIPVIIEDSIDSRLSIGSIDEDSLHSHHSHSDTNDININLLAQKAVHNNSTDIDVIEHNPNINHCISSIPHNTPVPTAIINTSAPVPDIPLMRLPPLVMPTVVPPVPTTTTTVMSVPPVVIMAHPPPQVVVHHTLDHTVMPPPLEPIEEALVASIVADLPQLTNDTDFTEVLNKIPDEAFSDFLLEHQNGEIPSTEETEALEQALAMVNKDVQNLVAVAGMNGNSSTQLMSDVSGQSDIIGFTNWLGSLTSEQRQQLNGLIDGAIASNSLSPILKNACEAYPQTVGPSSAPPIMKSSTTALTTNAFPIIYPINQLSLAPTQQEFVSISSPVPLLNNNLLMNGLSSHPS